MLYSGVNLTPFTIVTRINTFHNIEQDVYESHWFNEDGELIYRLVMPPDMFNVLRYKTEVKGKGGFILNSDPNSSRDIDRVVLTQQEPWDVFHMVAMYEDVPLYRLVMNGYTLDAIRGLSDIRGTWMTSDGYSQGCTYKILTPDIVIEPKKEVAEQLALFM